MEKYIKNLDTKKLELAYKIKQAYENNEIDLSMANAKMKAHVGSLTPSELAYIEQKMQVPVDDECIKEDLKTTLAIYEGVLLQNDYQLFKGHPIHNYLFENQEIKKVIANIDILLKDKYIKNVWDEEFEKLNQFKLHLSRKQNQLYSLLEKKGFDRPTKTMWLFDNVVRDKISELLEIIKTEFNLDDLKLKFQEFKEYILDLINKEEEILYPTSLDLIDDQEFKEMINGDKEIGYCLISPELIDIEKEAHKEEANNFQKELAQLLSKYNYNSWNEDTVMDVKQGRMSLKQINLLFQHLPVDISYVDENELVAFYSDTKHRVFPRSKGVIGRDVKNCHPKNSVAIVEEIINKFRTGEQDKAEFWINKPDVFIYILYTAVRDDKGNFKGVMEMMQDCTRIRSLTGSQTLLSWVSEKDEENKEVVGKDDVDLKEITSATKLSDLLKKYPDIKDKLIEINSKFKILNSPLAKIMIPLATIKTMAERSEMNESVLIEELNNFIKEKKND